MTVPQCTAERLPHDHPTRARGSAKPNRCPETSAGRTGCAEGHPKRPSYVRLGPDDEHPAEQVLRKLACWLGVGGYNAPTVDAGVFHDKIIWGVEEAVKTAAALSAAHPLPVAVEPAAVTEWREARAAAIAATEAYNAALRAARRAAEVKGFGFTNIDAEFQAMTQASNRVHKLGQAALDALAATPPEQPPT